MRLTSQTDYALRTLVHVACHRDRRVTTQEIAEAYRISIHHLLKIVNRLGSLGYLEVTRGHGGGLSLARSPEEIGIGQVVRDFEPFDLVECFDVVTDDCAISPACVLKGELDTALAAFLAVLDRSTLADAVARRSAALRRLLA